MLYIVIVIQVIQVMAAFDVPLTNLEQVFYSMPIQANGLIYNVIIDTGSPTLWLFDQSIRSYRSYSCNASTCQQLNNSSTLYYGVGSVHGNNTLSTVNDTQVSLLIVDQIDDLVEFQADGLIGFSKPEQNQITLLEALYQAKLIDKMSFGLSLNPANCQSTSVLTLGGYNESLFKEDLQFTPANDDILWIVEFEKLEFVGQGRHQMHTKSRSLMIDSGTTKITLPPTEFIQLIKMFNEVYQLDCDVNLHNNIKELECNAGQYPTIEIKLPTFYLTLYYQDYVQHCNYNYMLQKRCQLHFQEMPGDEIVLGVVFMQKYYTYFDLDTNSIGFAIASDYNRDQLKLDQLGNRNYAQLSIAIVGTTVTMIICYLIVWLLIKLCLRNPHLGTMEAYPLRSQEHDNEMITLKTQNLAQLSP